MNGSVLTFGTMLQTLLALVLVLGMVAGAAWMLRRFSAQPGFGGGGAIKVVAGAAIGQRERVVLVEVGGTLLVVGVAPGHVSTLHTLPKSAVDLSPQHGSGISLPNNFPAWLKQIAERRNGRA